MAVSKSTLILLLIVFLHYVTMKDAFEIKKTSILPKATSQVGDTLRLSCQADGYFEYCDWYHNGRVCKFEWKRWYSAVRKQSCNRKLKNRMTYVGKYDKHECKVELSNVEVSDSGNWTCKVEGYGFFTRGDIVEKHLSLKVMNYTLRKTFATSTLSPTIKRIKFTDKAPTITSSTRTTERTNLEEGTCQNRCPWSTKCNECSNCKWCSYCSSCSWPSEHCKYCNVCKDGPRDCVTCCGYE